MLKVGQVIMRALATYRKLLACQVLGRAIAYRKDKRNFVNNIELLIHFPHTTLASSRKIILHIISFIFSKITKFRLEIALALTRVASRSQ